MAETLGFTSCLTPTCDCEAEIKQASKHGGGTLYLHCPNCSIQYLRGEAGQNYLKKEIGILEEPEPMPEPGPAPIPEPEPGPIPEPQSPVTETTVISAEPEPEPAPEKKSSWFGEI